MTSQNRFLLCIVLTFNFVLLSVLCFWADSESWAVKVAGLEGAERYLYDYSVKPLFLWILSPCLSIFEISGVYYMDQARLLFAVNGLLIATLGSLCAYSLSGSKKSGWAFFLLLMTSALFLQRGFRVRADLLVSTVLLAMIYLHLQNRLHSVAKIGVLIIGTVLCLSLTLKSAFVLVCFYPFFVFQIQPGTTKKSLLKVFGFIGQLASITTVIVLLTDLVPLDKQLQYLVNQYDQAQTGLSALSLVRFQYVIRFIWQNPLVIFAVGLKICWLRSNAKVWRNNLGSFTFDLGIGLLVLLVLLYPNRLPFFLASLLPLLLLGALNYPWESSIWSYSQSWVQKYKFAWVLTLVAGFASLALSSGSVYFSNHNFQQRELVHHFQEYLQLRPGLKVYDPSGLIAKRGVFHNYLGPGQNEDHVNIVGFLAKEAPDIIFAGQRWAWVQQLFSDSTKSAYIKLDNGLLLKAYRVDRDPLSGDFASSKVKRYTLPRSGIGYIPPRKVILRARSDDRTKGYGRVYAMYGKRQVTEYPKAGLGLFKFRQFYSFNVETGFDQLLVLPIEYAAGVDRLNMKRLMSFDHWL